MYEYRTIFIMMTMQFSIDQKGGRENIYMSKLGRNNRKVEKQLV